MRRVVLSVAAMLGGAMIAAQAVAQPQEASLPGRLAPLQDSARSSEHKAASAKIDGYYDAPPSGPYAVWAHQPAVAEGSFEMFLAHRYEDGLERRLSELAIIIVGRNWSAKFPWTPHSSAALKFGVGPDVVEAIRLGRRPDFAKDDERAAYDLIQELTRERRIRQATYDRAIAVLGPRRVVALINVTGFYTMVAMSAVAFEMPLPERMNKGDPLPPLTDLPKAAFGPVPGGTKSRAPELDMDALTPGQRVEVAKIQALFQRPPAGPFQIWAHQPGVARGAVQLYLTHRYGNPADRRLMELMTITVARSWGCQMEWLSHARQAAENGVGPEIIEAIRVGEAPRFAKDDERAAYDLTNALSADRKISQATYDRAVAVLGTPRVVALVNGMSFYTMACMTIVAFDMPAPDRPGAPAPLPPLAARQ